MPHTRFSVFAHAGSLELDVYMYRMKAEQTVNRHGGSDFTRLAALERLEAQPLQALRQATRAVTWEAFLGRSLISGRLAKSGALSRGALVCPAWQS